MLLPHFNTFKCLNVCIENIVYLKDTPIIREYLQYLSPCSTAVFRMPIWFPISDPIFTRAQLWPSDIVVARVRLSVNHLLVRAITHQMFKLKSPNFDQKCKTPWLRALLFCGRLSLNFKVKFNLKFQIYSILVVLIISHQPFKTKPRYLDKIYIKHLG